MLPVDSNAPRVPIGVVIVCEGEGNITLLSARTLFDILDKSSGPTGKHYKVHEYTIELKMMYAKELAILISEIEYQFKGKYDMAFEFNRDHCILAIILTLT